MQVIAPIFESSFIHDSYAFRVGKGTHSALKRFDSFKRKAASRRFPNAGFILKADVLKDITRSIRGWVEYTRYADSYKLRKGLFAKYAFIKASHNFP